MTPREKAAAAHKPYKPSEKPSESSELTGDLVFFDAIRSKDLKAFDEWAKMRLDTDLAALTGLRTEPERRDYLAKSQKLRGYYSAGGSYVKTYEALQASINQWFRDHAAELAPLSVAGCLYTNFFVLNPVNVSHEELMRGTKAGTSRGDEGRASAGSILDALRALHPDFKTCPALPDLNAPGATKQPKQRTRKRARKGAAEEERVPAAAGH